MTTVAEDIDSMLAELNELRAELGLKPPVGVWKKSIELLEKEIDKLDKRLEMRKAPAKKAPAKKNPPKKTAAKKKVDKAKAKAKKKAPKKKATGKKRGPQPKNDGLLSVSDVARSLNMDPKVARAKLRRSGQSAVDGRWPRMKPNSKDHKAMITALEKGVRKEDD